ncbi:MAG: hypothetical protein F6K56_11230 [Moorea sp. SIO3G5]|nr:hypothetical protein [Moorena sp. SIO3G5]
MICKDDVGCISYLLFDPVVRYGTDFLNPGVEAENQGEPVPMLLAKYKLTSKTLILPLITLQNYKMFFDHYTEYQGFQRVKKCFASSIRP